MSGTFLDLCNSTLLRLNEVEIDPVDFASTRGVHSMVKKAVNAAIRQINQQEFEWPFNAASTTETLVAGQTEYTFPTDCKIPDWDSFQIQENSSLDAEYTSLDVITLQEWYKDYRDADYAAGNAGLGIPTKVFKRHGTGFGVTQSPDAAYSLNYRYFSSPTALSAYTDETLIPEMYHNVIVDGALYHFYMFRDNLEAASFNQSAFEQGVKHMTSQLINDFREVRDTRINY